jgi:hypothetical protein
MTNRQIKSILTFCTLVLFVLFLISNGVWLKVCTNKDEYIKTIEERHQLELNTRDSINSMNTDKNDSLQLLLVRHGIKGVIDWERVMSRGIVE